MAAGTAEPSGRQVSAREKDREHLQNGTTDTASANDHDRVPFQHVAQLSQRPLHDEGRGFVSSSFVQASLPVGSKFGHMVEVSRALQWDRFTLRRRYRRNQSSQGAANIGFDAQLNLTAAARMNRIDPNQ